MRVADVAQRHRINQVDVPGHERGKRLLGIVPRIVAHQIHVIGRHLTNTSTPV